MRVPRDDGGVASTVGTLFALLVVLLYMSAVFAAQDEAQKDREWELFREAQESLGLVQRAHNTQFLALTIPTLGPKGAFPTSLAVPVVASLPGLGPSQPPVVGRLYCDPVPVGTRLSFSFRAGAGSFDAVEESSGLLGIHLRTAKIPRATLLWENGALLVVQPDGALIWDYPYFRIDRLADGNAVTYRAVRVGGESWSVESAGTEIVNVRTFGPERIVLNVTGRGDANLDDVRQFVRDLKQEIRDVSTDGSGRLTGSYADDPPSEGILNQGLTEQLVYYDNAEAKQRIPDCEGASNDMNASARQLLLNTMDKILEGIDTGYIEEVYGLDLHTRMGNLLKCLDEMSGSLKEDCTFKCRSLFGGSGGRLEFLFSSEHRDAWRRWFVEYFGDIDLPEADWDVEVRSTFVLLTVDRVRQLSFEAAYVTVH